MEIHHQHAGKTVADEALSAPPATVCNSTPLVERDLHDLKAIARAHLQRLRMSGRRRETSVVNDAILRILKGRQLEAMDRGRFFGLMKVAMKSVLIDDLRKGDAQKNGGGWKRVPMLELRSRDNAREILPEELIEALSALEQVDPVAAQIYVLIEVYGSTIAGAAEVAERTHSQARGDHQYAGSWLKRHLHRSSPKTGPGTSR